MINIAALAVTQNPTKAPFTNSSEIYRSNHDLLFLQFTAFTSRLFFISAHRALDHCNPLPILKTFFTVRAPRFMTKNTIDHHSLTLITVNFNTFFHILPPQFHNHPDHAGAQDEHQQYYITHISAPPCSPFLPTPL